MPRATADVMQVCRPQSLLQKIQAHCQAVTSSPGRLGTCNACFATGGGKAHTCHSHPTGHCAHGLQYHAVQDYQVPNTLIFEPLRAVISLAWPRQETLGVIPALSPECFDISSGAAETRCLHARPPRVGAALALLAHGRELRVILSPYA